MCPNDSISSGAASKMKVSGPTANPQLPKLQTQPPSDPYVSQVNRKVQKPAFLSTTASAPANETTPSHPAPALNQTKQPTQTKAASPPNLPPKLSPVKHKNAVSSKIAPETAEMLSYDAPQNNETEKPASSARKPLGESRPHSKLPISKAERAAERAAEKAAEKAAEASTVASERATLEAFLENARSDLTAKLAKIEADIDTQEEDYIRSTWAHGNVLRGWDGFGRRVDRAEKLATGNGSGVSTGAPKHRKARPSDRIFSLSSSSSNFRKENPDVLIQKRSATTKKKKKR